MDIAEVHATRLPVEQWDSACQAGLKARQTGETRLLGADEADPRWDALVANFIEAPVWLHSVATHAGLLFEASLAISTPSICVLQRFLVTTQDDGTLSRGARDPDVEVSVAQHPWRLLRRVLPPLDILRAPARQTPSAAVHPVRLDRATRERVLAVHRADPSRSLAGALAREVASDSAVGELTDATSTAAYVVTTGTSDAALLGAGYYVASSEHLFRATFAADPAWEEVEAGDLAFSVEWHLLGARGHRARASAT